jgi:uncharacterized protein (TIGR00369 family)
VVQRIGLRVIRTLFEKWAAGGDPPQIARLIGFGMVEFEPDRTVLEFVAGPQHANPMGTLHGGILCDVADAAMGMAWASRIEEDETFTTLDLKINFFRPVWNARLLAEAKVLRRGKTIGYIECEVVDEADRLIAKAASTCMTLRGDRAAGR